MRPTYSAHVPVWNCCDGCCAWTQTGQVACSHSIDHEKSYGGTTRAERDWTSHSLGVVGHSRGLVAGAMTEVGHAHTTERWVVQLPVMSAVALSLSWALPLLVFLADESMQEWCMTGFDEMQRWNASAAPWQELRKRRPTT